MDLQVVGGVNVTCIVQRGSLAFSLSELIVKSAKIYHNDFLAHQMYANGKTSGPEDV